MMLSQGEIQMVVDWLNSKGISSECSQCKSTSKINMDHVTLATFKPNIEKPNFKEIIRSIILTCNNCGFVRLFSTAVMGLTS